MSQHTPTPWKYVNGNIVSSDDRVIVAEKVHENDAALIIGALNSFGDLLFTVKKYHTSFGNDEDGKPCIVCKIIAEAEAAHP